MSCSGLLVGSLHEGSVLGIQASGRHLKIRERLFEDENLATYDWSLVVCPHCMFAHGV